jgi:hypothetical protein
LQEDRSGDDQQGGEEERRVNTKLIQQEHATDTDQYRPEGAPAGVAALGLNRRLRGWRRFSPTGRFLCSHRLAGERVAIFHGCPPNRHAPPGSGVDCLALGILSGDRRCGRLVGPAGTPVNGLLRAG